MISHAATRSCFYTGKKAGNIFFVLSAAIMIALICWAFLLVGTVQAQETDLPTTDTPPAGEETAAPPTDDNAPPINGDDAAVNLTPESPPAEVLSDFKITTNDLGAVEARILPDSPFHIFKRWSRGIQEAFTFDPVKDAELKLRHANQQLSEIKQLIDEDGIETVDPDTISGAIDYYENKFEDVKNTADVLITAKTTDAEDVETLLNEVTDKQIKQQQALDNIAEEVIEVKEEAEMLGEDVDTSIEGILASVQDTKDKSMMDFADMIMAVDVDPEKVSARITGIMDKQGGSEFKSLKNLEVLDAVAEKVPETAHDAIAKAKENTIKKFEIRLKNLPEAVRAERFENYVEHSVTDETRLISLLEEIKQSTGIPDDILAKIEQAKEITVRKFEDKLRFINDTAVEDRFFVNFDPANVSDMITMEEFKNRMNMASEEFRIMESHHNKSIDEFKKRFTDVTSQDQAEQFKKLSDEMTRNLSPKTFKLLQELEAEVMSDPSKRAFLEQMEDGMKQKFETRFRREGDKFMDRMSTLDPHDMAIFENIEFAGDFKDKFMEKNTMNFKNFMKDVDEPDHFDRFQERFYDVPEFVINEIKNKDNTFQDAMMFKMRKMEERRMEKEREITMAKLDYQEREVNFQIDRVQREKEDEFWNKINQVDWQDFDTRKQIWEEKMNEDYIMVEQRFEERKRIFEERMKNDPWCDAVCQQIQLQFMEQEFRHEQERLADDLVRERNRIEAEKIQQFDNNPLAGKCNTPDECDQYCRNNAGVPGCEWAITKPMPMGCPAPGWWDPGQRRCIFPDNIRPEEVQMVVFKDCPEGEYWDNFKQSCIFDPYFKPPTNFIDCPPFHRWNDKRGTCEPEFRCETMYFAPPRPCAPGEMPTPPRFDDPCGQPSCIMGMPVICPDIKPEICPAGQFREMHKDSQGCPIPGECISSSQIRECPTEYMPVCGTDNKTYDNDCLAKKSGVGISFFGPCGMGMKNCPRGEYWEPIINKCLSESDYVPYRPGQCDNGWKWMEGYCSRDTDAGGQCKTYCEPACSGNSYCMYDNFGCAMRCTPECGPYEYFDSMTNMCVSKDQPKPEPGANNWVSHTWKFKDGQSETSYILNRTDQQYKDYIAKIHAQCLTIPKFQFNWMPSSGDSSNWQNFGIPNCTGGSPSSPICGNGICEGNEYCPQDCEREEPVEKQNCLNQNGTWCTNNCGEQFCLWGGGTCPPADQCSNFGKNRQNCETSGGVWCADSAMSEGGWCKYGEGFCDSTISCPSNIYNNYSNSFNCNYTKCPEGCRFDQNGCPDGCWERSTGYCGDNICQSGEQCPQDCDTTTSGCDYDGICEAGESNCPEDCGDSECPSGTYYCPEKGVNNVGTYCHLTPCYDEQMSCTTWVSTGESCDPSTGRCCSNGMCSNMNGPGVCETNNGYCGDGMCDSGETSYSCPGDCNSIGSYCGNGTCESGETSTSCPSDCGSITSCPSNIYNNYTTGMNCNNTECPNGCNYNSQGCPDGCWNDTSGYCGDGACEGSIGEDSSSCPSDCGSAVECPVTQYNNYSTTSSCNWSLCPNGCNFDSSGCPTSCGSASYCGDGLCDSSEDTTSCPSDCESSSTTGGYCGDGMCSNYEDTTSCPSDCGSNDTTMGCDNDGTCEYNESMSSCPNDCTGGTTYCPSNIYNNYGSDGACNFSECPNGCRFDQSGCPDGCYDSSSSSGYCGDGICENFEYCPEDCGSSGTCGSPEYDCGSGCCSCNGSCDCCSGGGDFMPCNSFNAQIGEYCDPSAGICCADSFCSNMSGPGTCQ